MRAIPNQANALRLQNARRVLLAALNRSPCTKPELAQCTGLTQMTVGKVVEQLLSNGLLVRAPDQLGPSQGRRPMRVAPNPHANLVGIEVGMRETAIYRFGLGGESESPRRRSLPALPSMAFLRAAWVDFHREIAPSPVRAVMVAVPGVVDTRTQTIVYSPNLHWTEGPALHAALAQDLAAPVCLVQEAQALALGHINAGPATDHFLLVELGDGIGSTVVAGGRLLGGPLPLSGEIGHSVVPGNSRRCGCGAVGCVETLAGRRGLLQSFRQHSDRPAAEWSDLVEALAGAALPPWLQQAIDAVSMVAACALNLLGYFEVVFVGDLVDLHPDVLPRLREGLMQHSLMGRFGRIECRAAPARRQLGLLATAVERVFLPAGAEPAGSSGFAIAE